MTIIKYVFKINLLEYSCPKEWSRPMKQVFLLYLLRKMCK